MSGTLADSATATAAGNDSLVNLGSSDVEPMLPEPSDMLGSTTVEMTMAAAAAAAQEMNGTGALRVDADGRLTNSMESSPLEPCSTITPTTTTAIDTPSIPANNPTQSAVSLLPPSRRGRRAGAAGRKKKALRTPPNSNCATPNIQKPRWHTQSSIMFLALRRAHKPLPRGELIAQAIALDEQVSLERGLPRVFTGKTPANSASAVLTNNCDKLFQSFKPTGSKSTWFQLAYEPGSFEKAWEKYCNWTERLIKYEWPIFFSSKYFQLCREREVMLEEERRLKGKVARGRKRKKTDGPEAEGTDMQGAVCAAADAVDDDTHVKQEPDYADAQQQWAYAQMQYMQQFDTQTLAQISGLAMQTAGQLPRMEDEPDEDHQRRMWEEYHRQCHLQWAAYQQQNQQQQGTPIADSQTGQDPSKRDTKVDVATANAHVQWCQQWLQYTQQLWKQQQQHQQAGETQNTTDTSDSSGSDSSSEDNDESRGKRGSKKKTKKGGTRAAEDESSNDESSGEDERSKAQAAQLVAAQQWQHVMQMQLYMAAQAQAQMEANGHCFQNGYMQQQLQEPTPLLNESRSNLPLQTTEGGAEVEAGMGETSEALGDDDELRSSSDPPQQQVASTPGQHPAPEDFTSANMSLVAASGAGGPRVEEHGKAMNGFVQAITSNGAGNGTRPYAANFDRQSSTADQARYPMDVDMATHAAHTRSESLDFAMHQLADPIDGSEGARLQQGDHHDHDAAENVSLTQFRSAFMYTPSSSPSKAQRPHGSSKVTDPATENSRTSNRQRKASFDDAEVEDSGSVYSTSSEYSDTSDPESGYSDLDVGLGSAGRSRGRAGKRNRNTLKRADMDVNEQGQFPPYSNTMPTKRSEATCDPNSEGLNRSLGPSGLVINEQDLDPNDDIPKVLEDVVEILPSTIDGAGNGVFAMRDIAPNTTIGLYFGVPMTEDEFDLLKDKVGQASKFSIRYRKTVLDATDETGAPFQKGHPSGIFCPFHFMNEDTRYVGGQVPGRSFESARKGNVMFLEGDEVNQILVVTKRFIQKGEELFAYYGTEIDRAVWNQGQPNGAKAFRTRAVTRPGAGMTKPRARGAQRPRRARR